MLKYRDLKDDLYCKWHLHTNDLCIIEKSLHTITFVSHALLYTRKFLYNN